MLDLRPVGYIIGHLRTLLGLLMLVPAGLDWWVVSGNAAAFMWSAFATTGTGLMLVLALRNAVGPRFSNRLAFALTLGIWLGLPLFGALPFMIGAPGHGFTYAYFEAVSGITTTGSTVIIGLDALPDGMNLWRGMLNWLGGLGIAFIAMIFLPVMRVGGMQFFRTEGFDTLGKILPRASDIALSLLAVYAALTVACILTYAAVGMTALDAVVNGMATVATGGFSPSDASFGKYPGAADYAGALFMILGSMPYIRYVQLVRGSAGPFLRDPQIVAFLRWLTAAVTVVVAWRLATSESAFEPTLRDGLFNLVSIFTGTGFFSGTFATWGSFGLIAAFMVGMIGGCSGSSSGALTVFRVQLMGAAIVAQVQGIRAPHRIALLKYAGRAVDQDALGALMAFVTGYILLIGVLSVAITMVGVDLTSALFGVWTSIGNIGYGIGPLVAGTGTFIEFPTAAEWILIAAMLLGRLALLTVLVALLPQFWRR